MGRKIAAEPREFLIRYFSKNRIKLQISKVESVFE